VIDSSLSFAHGWGLAILLIAACVALTVYLYRTVDSGGRRRKLMSAAHLLAALMLVLILMRPALDYKISKPFRSTIMFMVDTSESMAIEDNRTDKADIEVVKKIMEKSGVTSASRIDLAKAALRHTDADLIKKLSEQHELRFFTFDETLQPQSGGEDPLAWTEEIKAEGKSSRIGTAVDSVVNRYAGQPIAGVVVLSDFSWVEGSDPLEASARLKQRGIPLYCVGIGLPDPPDVQVRRMIAPDVVFAEDKIPIRVQIDSSGYKGETSELVMKVDDAEVVKKSFALEGGSQFIEFDYTPEKKSGTINIETSVTPMLDETTEENNQVKHSMRILDEKIKVLYVEGHPRWEFRYLRRVLLRDHRLEVTFLMTEGDDKLPDISEDFLKDFPKEVGDALAFDLVILGDVDSSKFDVRQMELMEKLVKESGGSLLMIAGPVGSPTSYSETPVADILPVSFRTGKWESISDTVHPVLTEDGKISPSTVLASTLEENKEIWNRITPLHEIPPGLRAKPSARVLLTLPKEADTVQDYPLIAWGPYGNGKSMFVGTEALWRMRLEAGSKDHGRFWSQTIKFLTLSRLLGQNKRITLETSRKSYGSGEEVLIYANVLSETYEPVDLSEYTVTIGRAGDDDGSELELTSVPDQPGLYSGVHYAGAEGDYQIKAMLDDAEAANVADFSIVNIPLEGRETAVNTEVARQMAELSGGKVVALSDLPTLPSEFGYPKEMKTTVSRQQAIWDVPFLFVLFVLFAGVEWYVRRKDNLV
jgi:uncharacterized membrane protein